jgi:hypothetical protein
MNVSPVTASTEWNPDVVAGLALKLASLGGHYAAGMAGKGRLVRNVVKFGVRYGPVAYEAVKHGREPAQQAVQAAVAKRNARRTALEHAGTVRDGSLLKVLHEGRPVWFVFSGDEIVATYPPVPIASYGELLRHADLANRIRPADVPAKPKIDPRALLRRKR